MSALGAGFMFETLLCSLSSKLGACIEMCLFIAILFMEFSHRFAAGKSIGHKYIIKINIDSQ